MNSVYLLVPEDERYRAAVILYHRVGDAQLPAHLVYLPCGFDGCHFSLYIHAASSWLELAYVHKGFTDYLLIYGLGLKSFHHSFLPWLSKNFIIWVGRSHKCVGESSADTLVASVCNVLRWRAPCMDESFLAASA